MASSAQCFNCLEFYKQLFLRKEMGEMYQVGCEPAITFIFTCSKKTSVSHRDGAVPMVSSNVFDKRCSFSEDGTAVSSCGEFISMDSKESKEKYKDFISEQEGK